MAIDHIEDLDVRDFIDTVRNLGNMDISEKLDGANLWAGIDNQGRLFTTRAGKRENAERFYSEADYPYFAAYNGFRATHAALDAKKSDIKSVMSNGDTFEIEVLYGRQPNAITYGLDSMNFIAFLRGVEGTPDSKVNTLASLLHNNETTVKVTIVDTTDGINLDRKNVSETFRFVGVQKIDGKLVKNVNVEKHLKKLEEYLDKQSSIDGLTNFELMTKSLGSIPKDARVEAKTVKEQILATVKTKFKVEIKKELLSKFVAKIKPALGASDLSNDEDVGIEGVVLRDPETGKQLKIVDKDGFTTINQFNFAVRNQIAGMIRTLEDGAPIESRGGITGVMKIRLADMVGNKELALGRSAKKIFNDHKGKNPTETIKNVAAILKGDDYNGSKKKATAVISATLDDLNDMLASFKKHQSDDQAYRLKMKNGKSIGLSPEIVKRTLMTFAETKRNLEELKDKVGATKSFEQLISVLYGRNAKAAHSAGGEEDLNEDLNEEIFRLKPVVLLEKHLYTDLSRFEDVKDMFTLLNAYLATVMMTVLIYKANDERGLKLVRDKAHWRMTKWAPEMGALNFWGMPVWHTTNKTIAKHLPKKVASEMFKVSRKVPAAWVKFLHMDLSFGRDVPIDWHDHLKTLQYLVQHAEGQNIERINNLLTEVFNYDELSFDAKVKFLPKLYFFAQQFVSTSPLMTRVKAIQHELLTGDSNDEMPVIMSQNQKLLGEDGEIATGPVASSSTATTATSTTSSAIAPLETGIGTKKMIVRRKRNPNIILKKFARPTTEGEK